MASPPDKKQKRYRHTSTQLSIHSEAKQTEQDSAVLNPTKPAANGSSNEPSSVIRTPVVYRQAHAPKPPGSSSRTLLSFFNSKTASQTIENTPAYRSSTRKGSLPDASRDDLEDDITDGELHDRITQEVPKSRAISALKHRRHTQLRTRDGGFSPSQKTPIPLLLAKGPQDHQLWSDQFEPESLQELVVNKKKTSAVQSWLNEALQGHRYRRMLVLRGPAGCGKSSTIRLIARSNNFSVSEWVNPVPAVWGDESYLSVSTQFQDFIGRAGTFGSLSFSERDESPDELTSFSPIRRVLLLKELPLSGSNNTLLQNQLKNAVLLHLEAPAAMPVVLIVSEGSGTLSRTSDRVSHNWILGPDITNHPAVTTIEFNSIAPTFMMKALEAVMRKETQLSGRKRDLNSKVMRSLASSGDIRCAINTLQILCLEKDDNNPTRSTQLKRTGVGSKKDDEIQIMDKLMPGSSTRDEPIGLFHCVGKVIYNKRDEQADVDAPFYLHEYRRPLRSAVSADEISRLLGTEVGLFVDSLHENYVLSCQSDDPLKHIEAAAMALSSVDAIYAPDKLLSNCGRGYVMYQSSAEEGHLRREINLHLAIRGLLFSLPHPVKRSSRTCLNPYQISYPTGARLHELRRKTQEQVKSWIRSSSQIQSNLVRGSNDDVQPQKAVGFWGVASEQCQEPGEFTGGSPGDSMNGLGQHELITVQLPFEKIIADSGRSEDASTLHDDAGSDEKVKAIVEGQNSLGPTKSSSLIAGNGGTKLVLSDDDIED